MTAIRIIENIALQCAKTAFETGARWVVLCDTNGGTLPDEVDQIVRDVIQVIPGENLGIHTHDDYRSRGLQIL